MRYYKEDILQHYGIPGQKWGVRRFESEDGTLTEAGKLRYSTSPSYKKHNFSIDDYVYVQSSKSPTNRTVLKNVNSYVLERISSDSFHRTNKVYTGKVSVNGTIYQVSYIGSSNDYLYAVRQDGNDEQDALVSWEKTAEKMLKSEYERKSLITKIANTDRSTKNRTTVKDLFDDWNTGIQAIVSSGKKIVEEIKHNNSYKVNVDVPPAVKTIVDRGKQFVEHFKDIF